MKAKKLVTEFKGTTFHNCWIVKVDSLGNIRRLSTGSKHKMVQEYHTHHYTVNDGYHVVSVESQIKDVVI